jgi:hypothetical protein
MGWSWRNKKTTCAGSVLFRGSVPPRAEEFAHLAGRGGFEIAPAEPGGAAHWGLLVSHPKWGRARVTCLRDCPRPGRQLIDLDPMLTRPEREAAYLGDSSVSVVVEGERQDVLRDRKTLLRFMRAVMGDDGVVAVDHTAQRFWPPEALDDEVGHDADLDIESLYTLHAVTAGEDGDRAGDDEDDDEVLWLHSHGLAEIGLFDFDVLRPSEDLLGRGRDALRAVAFAILDGLVSRNTARFALMMPGSGSVRFVDVRDFIKRAGRAANDLRPGADAEHNRDRAVLCDVAGGGWLGRLLGRGGRVTPSRLLSQAMPAEMMVPFSTSASNLMAERAKGTYLQFRQLAGEFAEFDFPVIVKLGYRIDGGSPEDREHLWFEVNHLHDDRIDATLESVPQAVRKLTKGQRGWHMLDLLTDWAIPTPLGTITPRYTVPARQIRGNREKFRQLMREARRVSEAG